VVVALQRNDLSKMPKVPEQPHTPRLSADTVFDEADVPV
jgi:hypothetical protein